MPGQRTFVIDLYLSRRLATVLIAAVVALAVLGARCWRVGAPRLPTRRRRPQRPSCANTT